MTTSLLSPMVVGPACSHLLLPSRPHATTLVLSLRKPTRRGYVTLDENTHGGTGFGEHDGQPFIVMQFLMGQTLQQRIAHGPLEKNELTTIAIQIAQALDAAHEKGIIHRDIKPANVLLTTGDQVKLLDFGLAKLVEQGSYDMHSEGPLTAPGIGVGTPYYMSPVQRPSGERADPRSVESVSRSGCTLGSPSIDRRCKSYPVSGACSVNIRLFPSGEKDSGYWGFGLVVRRSVWPVPSAAFQFKLLTPSRLDLNTIRSPSGVHVGSLLSDASKVSRAGVFRLRSKVHTSLPSESLMKKAICSPSGDTLGHS